MNTSIEKMKECYVLCSLDLEGKTVYLRSLHEKGQWEITTDIELATKAPDRDTAEFVRDFYMQEVGNGEWLITPVIIQYMLVNES